MAVVNGQNADENTFNNAFVSKTQDSSTAGVLEVANTNTASGPTITNVQRELNSISSFLGKAINLAKDVLPAWASTNFGAANATVQAKIEALDAEMVNRIATSEKGAANGVATLDGSGRIPSAQLTTEAFEYKGVYDANTNTPTLVDGTGTTGDVYRVNVAGSQDFGSGSISFQVNDKVVYNGTIWEKWDTTDDSPEPDIEYITLDGTQATNKEVTLSATPITPSKVMLDIIGGTAQEYGVDYSVSGAVLTWDTLGLDGVLASGDKLRIVYWA